MSIALIVCACVVVVALVVVVVVLARARKSQVNDLSKYGSDDDERKLSGHGK